MTPKLVTGSRLRKLVRGICAAGCFKNPLEKTKGEYGWFGNFQNWEEAEKLTTGYAADNILEKVRAALLKVKDGEEAYERDSVLFDKIEYSWPLLAGLMWIAAREGGVLNVVDFGGSLGSSYFQNRKFLSALKEVTWSIVEQPGFVACGKKFFEDEHLKFYHDLESCVKKQKSGAILLSSVLQYLEKPYEMVKKIIDFGFPYVLFDRTGFTIDGRDRLTIQKVPPRIYAGSYPCWFLDEERFKNSFRDNYDLVAEFKGPDRANFPSVFKGFIFKKHGGKD